MKPVLIRHALRWRSRFIALCCLCCLWAVTAITASAGAPPPVGVLESSKDDEVVFIDLESTQSPEAAEPTPRPGPAPTYQLISDSVRVEITECNTNDNVYFATEIWLTDPSHLRSAFSSDRFDGPTETVKDIAERNGAVVAINGDFATFNNGGIIIRNGELYRGNRSTRQLLVIDADGDFHAHAVPPEDAEETAAAYMEQGVWQTLVFGPVLVENGEAVPLPEKFFINTKGAREPRTVIAQLGPLHYLFLVVDGRQDEYSRGMTLAEVQELLLSYGVITAFNLDGGGSTTLYFNGNVVNRPANGGQRQVPDILYIME